MKHPSMKINLGVATSHCKTNVYMKISHNVTAQATYMMLYGDLYKSGIFLIAMGKSLL